MAAKKRSANFDESEKMKLAELVKDWPIIEDKRTDCKTNKLKEDAWTKVGENFENAFPDRTKRSVSDLKRLWIR